MTHIIKEFIEENIEHIENNQWFLLFLNWYNNPHKQFPDTNEWDELIEVLQHVDKNILETTKNYRESVILMMTRDTIDEIKNNQDSWLPGKQVSLGFLLLEIVSPLGLTEDEIIQLIHQAAELEHLNFDSHAEIFTWS